MSSLGRSSAEGQAARIFSAMALPITKKWPLLPSFKEVLNESLKGRASIRSPCYARSTTLSTAIAACWSHGPWQAGAWILDTFCRAAKR
jgi:hypothetical protein